MNSGLWIRLRYQNERTKKNVGICEENVTVLKLLLIPQLFNLTKVSLGLLRKIV